MGCRGLHCDGCGHRGSVVPFLAAAAAAVLLASGAASVLVHVLALIAIAIGATAVLATAGVIAWLVRQSRQEAPGRAIAVRDVSQLPPGTRPGLPGTCNRSLGASREVHHHVHLPAGMTADELAAALRRIDHPEAGA